LFGDRPGQAAALQVRHGPRRLLELLAVSIAGFLQHVRERGLLLALLCGAGAVLRRGVDFGDLHPVLLGKVLDGLDEIHAGMLHQEADGVAVLAAAEAVVELLARADRERGRLFPVEGAQPHVIGAALLQLHVPADDLHHVGPREQLLDERLGDGHTRYSCLMRRRR
jgi:hypothetical protein